MKKIGQVFLYDISHIKKNVIAMIVVLGLCVVPSLYAWFNIDVYKRQVGKIVDHGKEICFPSGMEKMGPTIQKLYDTLTGIQMGHIEAPEGWIQVIE